MPSDDEDPSVEFNFEMKKRNNGVEELDKIKQEKGRSFLGTVKAHFGIFIWIFAIFDLFVTQILPFFAIIGLIGIQVLYDLKIQASRENTTVKKLIESWGVFEVIEKPSRKDLFIYIPLFTGLSYAAVFGVSVLFETFLPGSSPEAHAGIEAIGGSLFVIPVYVLLFFLFIAPLEEFIFRHKLQKEFLDGGLIRRVLIANVLFGLAHFIMYFSSSIEGIFMSLSVITVVGIMFGLSYEASDNLTVPICIHGLFNSIAVAFTILF